MELNRIYNEDCLDTMARMDDESIDCVITSPPYWGLRDYGTDGQLGLEKTPEEYVQKMVQIFAEVRRVLKKESTLWLNLGDSYVNNSIPGGGDPTITKRNIGNSKHKPTKVANLKPKDMVGIPWRVAFALQADGWYLRSDIIWSKPNPMPESVTDRPTKAHEYIFLMTKSAKYYYDADAIAEKTFGGDRRGPDRKRFPTNIINGIRSRFSWEGRNKRTVWTIPTQPYPEAHFATYPEKLIEPCVLAGCPEGGIIYDSFGGAMTTALVALRAERNFICSEINPEYCDIGEKRLWPLLNQHKLAL